MTETLDQSTNQDESSGGSQEPPGADDQPTKTEDQVESPGEKQAPSSEVSPPDASETKGQGGPAEKQVKPATGASDAETKAQEECQAAKQEPVAPGAAAEPIDYKVWLGKVAMFMYWYYYYYIMAFFNKFPDQILQLGSRYNKNKPSGEWDDDQLAGSVTPNNSSIGELL